MAHTTLAAVTLSLAILAQTIKVPMHKKANVENVPSHIWACKNGNLMRNGVSHHSAPVNLTTPLWEWAVPGHNEGFGNVESSPLIDSNGNVYLATTSGSLFKLARNGTELWRLEGLIRALTPALDGNALYVGTVQGEALSVDLATGRVNWRVKHTSQSGCDGWTATVAEGLAVFAGARGQLTPFGGNDQVVALRTADGSEAWRFRMGPFKFNYNFMPIADNGQLLFQQMDGVIYCLDMEDGTQLWRTSANSGGGFTTAGVAAGPNGMVYTNFNANGGTGGVVVAYDRKTGAERWRKDLGLEAAAAPAVGPLGPNGRVAVIVGMGQNAGSWSPELKDAQAKLMAFDADTGAEIWTFTTPHQLLHGSRGIYSVPNEDSIPDTWSTAAIGSDGTVYAGWEGGRQYAINGTTGEEISSHYTGFGSQGGPAIGDNFIVMPSVGLVVAFGTP
jgi:outer membrane protein assembly factor BamB